MRYEMRVLLCLGLILLLIGGWPSMLLADSTGAWPVEHSWQDKMPGGKTYAEGYHEFAAQKAKELYEKKEKLDCADMSIAIFVEYAHQQKLEVKFWFPAEKKTVSSKDAQFKAKGFSGFIKWARNYVGAQNLADNTFAVPIDSSKAGDVVLFDWGQSPEWPNFPGRVVWHTYVIGSDGAKVVYYGNEDSNNQPMAVTIAGESVQERIRTHPDRYGSGARRWNCFKEKPSTPTTPPTETPLEQMKADGEITAEALNIRGGPGTSHGVVTQLKKGEKIKITGKQNGWYRLDLGNGKVGWASGKYIKAGAAGVLDRINNLRNNRSSNSNNRNSN